MTEFNSTNTQLASFIVSVYLLGYCFGPLAIAPLSEMYGRLPLYHVCNVLFVIFNVACALAPNLGGLIAFRLLAGLAGSCPLTIGAGSLADMISKEKRGAAMSSWALGPLFGPVIGPVGKYIPQLLKLSALRVSGELAPKNIHKR
jgi:MFS family permease